MSSFLAEVLKINGVSEIFAGSKRILLAISGGIDSLCMAKVMSEYRSVINPELKIEAVHVQIPQVAIDDVDLRNVTLFLDNLGIPLTVIDGSVSDEKPFDCYSCAKERRKRIFQFADSKNIAVVALGHNLDDYLETALMNMVFNGHLESLAPLQAMFDGKISVVRPLLSVSKKHIWQYAKKQQFPVQQSRCKFECDNQRESIRKMMINMQKINRAFYPNLRKVVNCWNNLSV